MHGKSKILLDVSETSSCLKKTRVLYCFFDQFLKLSLCDTQTLQSMLTCYIFAHYRTLHLLE